MGYTKVMRVKNCPACGSDVFPESIKCETCGKRLSEGYQPLDLLKASYRLQGKPLVTTLEGKTGEENLFETNKNPASETAFACFVYSLVPYLGIIFIPLALIAGSYGVFVAETNPELGGKKLSLISLSLSLLVLILQILLWWLLYLIPELVKLN
ncbi:MAG: hypothetical protein D6687_00435 [Acidobacteria bacterium]|jgi:hypothetical protein|nr:MAG: hypothetical protein D6687_00435 [Acidobacteriota bacterium]GIU81064.1 MAG: hypothetical protein KatS3mg006_0128 [Pyrinomonadaceae bacterium]